MARRRTAFAAACGALLLAACGHITPDPPPDRTAGIASGMNCDCDYRNVSVFRSGGCRIVDPAPSNTACYCKYNGFWTCSGQVTVCEDLDSPDCKSPSRDKASCQQGGGDCGGYQD